MATLDPLTKLPIVTTLGETEALAHVGDVLRVRGVWVRWHDEGAYIDLPSAMIVSASWSEMAHLGRLLAAATEPLHVLPVWATAYDLSASTVPYD